MAVTSPISAFYEPGAPPPPVPLLTHQTELYYSPTHSNTLIVQEELPPNPITVKRHNVASLPREPVRFTADPLEDGRASSPSDSGSFESSDSELTDLSDDGLIPKPDGEAGRPGRGGYNLETALNWNPKSFRKLKSFIKSEAESKLDMQLFLSYQSLTAVQDVKHAAMKKFKDLEQYQGCWPVMDLLRARLKASASKYRREQRMKDAEDATAETARLKLKLKKAKKSTVKR